MISKHPKYLAFKLFIAYKIYLLKFLISNKYSLKILFQHKNPNYSYERLYSIFSMNESNRHDDLLYLYNTSNSSNNDNKYTIEYYYNKLRKYNNIRYDSEMRVPIGHAELDIIIADWKFTKQYVPYNLYTFLITLLIYQLEVGKILYYKDMQYIYYQFGYISDEVYNSYMISLSK